MRSSRRTLAALAILAFTTATLLAMGRRPWCRCGSPRLWVSDASGPENSQHLLDPYSFTHLTHGVLLYVALRLLAPAAPLATRALVALAAESGWEIVENSDPVIERYRAATIALGYHGDSVANSIGDILCCMLGFFLAARLPVPVTATMVVVQEALLLVWIRDSLLVNIVMLVHPIGALKRWQIGSGVGPS